MICGWDGCKNESTAIWEITDSFDRTYQKDACEECARYWLKHRPRCIKIRDLPHAGAQEITKIND